ncbi:iron-siderophore ABC transporter substrate-binding protein [Neptunomonas phycophila]|nr:iron-siderophore ABC transporter substrate-binding protein [Neptunomonas phycophila]
MSLVNTKKNCSFNIKKTGLACALTLSALFTTHTAFADVTVDTKYGAVTVKDNPERVVTLFEGALDTAYALGVTPVGVIATRGADRPADYMFEKTGKIDVVGTARETNLEAVLALKPDVILASSRLSKEQYDLLSNIAPTVVPNFTPYQADTWKNESRLFAHALSKDESIEQLISTIEKRTQSLSSLLNTTHPDESKTSLVRWMPQGPLLMSTGTFASTLLKASGFVIEDTGLVKAGRPHSSSLSLENLSVIDGDWLFLATLNEDGKKSLQEATQSPAFSRLNVVKDERVIPVDGQVWTSASGPIAANLVLDTIENVIKTVQ